LLFELTRDYRIILPLMAAVGLSSWLVERLRPIAHDVSTSESTGLSFGSEADVGLEVSQRFLVAEVIEAKFITVPATVNIAQAGSLLAQHSSRCGIVVDESNQVVGIVTLKDFQRAITRWKQHHPCSADHIPPIYTSPLPCVGDICTHEVLLAFTDEPLQEAVERMAARDLRQLPVVDRLSPKVVIGLLTKEQIELTYQLAAVKEALQPLATRTDFYLVGSDATAPICLK
jgi:CBS domain-containing protein